MIDVHAHGTGQTAALLNAIADRALDPRPAFEAVTDRLIDAEKRLFASERRTAPLKDSTKARKRRAKDPRVRANAETPLQATGALEKFLTTRGLSAQPVKLTENEMIFGVPGGRHDLHYARYQVKHGRNPLISRDVLHRAAQRELTAFIVRGRP